MQQKTPVHKEIVEQRMNMAFMPYLDKCIARIEEISPKSLLNGLGELVNEELKTFVSGRLKDETIQLLKMYKEFPLFG